MVVEQSRRADKNYVWLVGDDGYVAAVDSDGKLSVSATISAEGIATSANQTSGDQKSQIVDGSGNVIGSTSNALDVNIKSGAGAGGTASTDDSAFTPGTTNITPVGGQTSADSVDAGDTGAFLMDTDRHQQIDVVDISKGTQTNDIKITLDGESVGVTGTVTANAGTNLNTSALALESGGNLAGVKTDTSTIAGDTTSLDGKVTKCDTDNISGSVTCSATNLDIRDLTNSSDSVAIYGSDDGGTTKRIIKTDSGGAIQVDLEVASVTANAGTNLNTSALALESGGNLAGVKTDTSTIAGDTTSIDGKITACNTGSISGAVTANAGTNLNTSALALESGGNLATIAGDTTSLDSKVTACNTGACVIASALPAGANNIGKIVITDGSNDATIRNLAANDALNVAIVDGSGNQVTSFGGTGGTSMSDDAAFTPGSTSFTPVGGQTSVDAVNAGDGGAFLMDTDRHQQIDIVDVSKGTQTNDIKITLDGESVSISGTVTANAGTNLNTSALALESGGNLATIASDTTSIDGKITSCNTGAVVISSGAVTETNSGSIKTAVEKIDDLQAALKSVDTDELVCRLTDSSGTEINPAKEDGNLGTIAGDTTSIDGKITACNTGAISGSVTANAGTNLNTSALALESGGNLATIAGDTTSLDSKVTACNTGAVVISSGAITETNSGSIKTAVELIDDAIATHDSAATSKGAQINAAYDSTKPTAVGDGDAVRVLADQYGRLLPGLEPEHFQATITSADAQSATTVKAKTADKKMYILSLIISTDTAMNVQLQDDAGTPNVLMEQIYLAANGGIAMNFPEAAPLVVTTNQDLDVIASAAGNISVTVTGYLAP